MTQACTSRQADLIGEPAGPASCTTRMALKGFDGPPTRKQATGKPASPVSKPADGTKEEQPPRQGPAHPEDVPAPVHPAPSGHPVPADHAVPDDEQEGYHE